MTATRGHDKHAGHSVAMFRDKFWLSLAADDPDAHLGPHAPAGVRLHRRRSSRVPRWIPPVFGTAVFLYGGLAFHPGRRARAARTGCRA